jgi:hypothetical protein
MPVLENALRFANGKQVKKNLSAEALGRRLHDVVDDIIDSDLTPMQILELCGPYGIHIAPLQVQNIITRRNGRRGIVG